MKALDTPSNDARLNIPVSKMDGSNNSPYGTTNNQPAIRWNTKDVTRFERNGVFWLIYSDSIEVNVP